MLDDICTLCSINSERSAYQRRAIRSAKVEPRTGFTGAQNGGRVWIFHQQLRCAFYVGTADLNDGEHQLRYSGTSGCCPGRRGLDCDTAV
ncbi:MAG: hypothetical protein ACLT76_01190 [Clostridium fessum]